MAKIAADELGITAGIQCFTTGNLGACGETALNVLASLASGLVGKLATKYAAPWKWARAYELGKQIWKHAGDTVSGFKGWLAAKDKLKIAEKAREAAQHAFSACARPNSFVPGTPVLMADGTHKPIDQVKTGDKVTATDTHPFWVTNLREWVPATRLTPGAWLRTSTGTHVQITAITKRTVGHQRVHNLTIADIRSYHVVVGAENVLVHNAGPSDPLNFGSGYKGRLDRINIGGRVDFEIHVYYRGKEVGIFGSGGWFRKHGKSADVTVPRDVYNNLKGLAIGEMRASGRLRPKGAENIKGDNWMRPRITGGC